MTEVEIQTERIDDIPSLIHHQHKMGIPEVLDNVIHPRHQPERPAGRLLPACLRTHAEELRQPLPGETWKTRLVRLSQRLNRGSTEAKLRKLLSDFEWTSVREWMGMHMGKTSTRRQPVRQAQHNVTRSREEDS